MKVRFVDLSAQYEAHREELDSAVARVIERSAYIGGEFVQRFEAEFAKAVGRKHCIAVGNGTDAIYVVLRMLGIGPGDEVITTAITWIATSETISQTGATPVFVDVDEYLSIDVQAVAAAFTPRTKAVIPVHLYGHPADLDPLSALCRERGAYLIEDCAQAHLARYNGRLVGTEGVAATYSFYPGKNLGAWGDAGAIVTDDDELARKCRMFANHGALVKHQHMMEGINSRLDGLQASVLLAKLPHLPQWTAERRRVAGLYDRLLAASKAVRPLPVRAGAEHVYHLYVIRAQDRDGLKSYLASKGIETAVHYPKALPLQPAYAHLGVGAEAIPNAARAQDEILSLPLYAELPAAAVEYVCRCIADYYGEIS